MSLNQNELAHHGIKGMKWGVRKDKKKEGVLARRRREKEEKYSEDYRQYQALKKRKTYELSNQELQALIKRNQLEVQYKDLKRKDISTGRKFAQDMARQTAATAITFYSVPAAKRFLGSGASVRSNVDYAIKVRRSGRSVRSAFK